MDFIVNNHKITTPIIEIVERLQLLSNGEYLASVKDKGDYISITCPFHKDGKEDKPSASVYARYDSPTIYPGTYNCFTCDSKGTLVQLVSKILHISNDAAKSWLVNNFGGEKVSESSYFEEVEDFDLKPTYSKIGLDENSLDGLVGWHPYLCKRHLDREICKQFEVKYDPKTDYIVFPVRNSKGELSYLTKRSTNNKSFNIAKGVEKEVYLLYYIKQQNIKTVYVCESQINALTLWGWGKPAISLFGCKITPYQLKQLSKSGIYHYILCFDGDKAGWGGMCKAIRNIDDNVFVDVIIVPKGKDVNDLTREEFEALPIYDGLDWLNKLV